MKRAYVFFLLISFVLSCKKENPQPQPTILDKLQGTWELRYRSGGLAGIHDSFSQGNGNIIIFYSNSRFKEECVFCNPTKTEGYITIFSDSIDFCGSHDRIKYFNDLNTNLSLDAVSFKDNKLNLCQYAMDGFERVYEKIAP
jgi:hypothetical protein